MLSVIYFVHSWSQGPKKEESRDRLTANVKFSQLWINCSSFTSCFGKYFIPALSADKVRRVLFIYLYISKQTVGKKVRKVSHIKK